MKKNEKVEDKLIFRWKLVTLALSIIFIVCLGIFSQLLRSINELPDVNVDKSFIIPMLQQVSNQAVPNIRQVQSLIKGISSSSESQGTYFQWNKASLLASYDSVKLLTLNVTDLQSAIQGQSHLVFVISSTETPAASKFGFYVNHQFSSSSQAIFDDSSTSYSI
jgi:hypothetical protein